MTANVCCSVLFLRGCSNTHTFATYSGLLVLGSSPPSFMASLGFITR